MSVGRLLVSAAIFCILASCRERAPVAATAPTPEMLRAVVPNLRAVLSHYAPPALLLDSTRAIDSVFVGLIQRAETAHAEAHDVGAAALAAPARTAVTALIANRAQRLSLPRHVFDSLDVRLVAVPPPFDTYRDWEHPRISFGVSAVGYDPRARFAALYWVFYCGNNCAGGTLYVFERQKQRGWALVWSRALWQE